ncbi:ankyrin repeat domain-containing protein [Pseudobacillus wudalianchiensis]|uniref:Uncharacterized protein n=1 Tax=Pseudobacillus wudalianchiensis TaxID=1743143 RepID=A0A1B9AN67_9BACI|nr:ankyrin repeat domain-containing protein [Bacillus wudalianchiensis]OCA85088.1 hypothetical protein A8F95_10380 [Bacillus wudalianchiensis]
MWKRITVWLGCLLLLPAYGLNDNQEQGKEREAVEEGVNEQLLQAAEQRETEKVKKLIKKGADINIQDEKKRTPIMIATYHNDVETATVLIKAGADVNIQDHIKNTPFLYAGAEGYIEILKLTIEAGADPTITNRYGGTALIPASEHGYIEVIKELLTKTDIDINHVNNLGWTALMEAIILNNGDKTQQETIQLLIDHGADVNIPDHDMVTPLQHAREKGFKEIEKILLQAGAK